MLGFAKSDGPDSSEEGLASRGRAARVLLSLAFHGDWAITERLAAKTLSDRFPQAVEGCAEDLPAVLKARRQIKLANLTLHKELGFDAIKMIISNMQVQISSSTRSGPTYFSVYPSR